MSRPLPVGGRFDRPPVRQQLSDKAASHVRGLIMSGELRPGAGVRPETIGEALGISATPAREALQSLRVEGFLVAVPRQGFVVAPLTGQDIRDLFQAQALVAGELAARAAKHSDPADLAELEALHHELIAAAARGNQELLEEKNHEFHRLINLTAGTPKMVWVLGLLARYVPRRFYAEIPGWPTATVDDHGALLAALQARNPDRARAAMHDHITHAGELLAAHFDHRIADAATDPDN